MQDVRGGPAIAGPSKLFHTLAVPRHEHGGPVDRAQLADHARETLAPGGIVACANHDVCFRSALRDTACGGQIAMKIAEYEEAHATA